LNKARSRIFHGTLVIWFCITGREENLLGQGIYFLENKPTRGANALPALSLGAPKLSLPGVIIWTPGLSIGKKYAKTLGESARLAS
jgi:hypothetical protein